MSINLQKGQKIDLTKGGTGLKQIMVGLGWDEAQQSSSGGGFLGLFKSKPQDIDCDASAILCNTNGKYMDLVYYRNLKLSDGSIVHQGDNLTGAGEGDDEQIKIALNLVPENIVRIAFTVTIYDAETRRQNFGQVNNAFIRIYNEATGEEMLRYDLGEDFSIETAAVFGELYKNNGEWKFNAIGSGFQGGLAALCSNYGIETE